MGTEAPPGWASCVAAWTEGRLQLLCWQRQEESAVWVAVEGGIPLGECLAGQTLEHFPAKGGRG